MLLHLIDAYKDSPPVYSLYSHSEYIIERFKSFGDLRFFNIAMLIVEVNSRLHAIDKIKTTSDREDSRDFLERYTQALGNKMFVCRVSSNIMLLSKSLLSELEFEPE